MHEPVAVFLPRRGLPFVLGAGGGRSLSPERTRTLDVDGRFGAPLVQSDETAEATSPLGTAVTFSETDNSIQPRI